MMSVIAGYRATIAANPDRYAGVQRGRHHQAAADGRIAISFDLKARCHCWSSRKWYRCMPAGRAPDHFAYNRNNSVADGCHDLPRGLTPLGHRMVAAVNDAGILMDCAHTGRLCSLDIMSASSQPVIFSHANPYTLVPHGRNVTDEQIRACAATGGVVCVSGLSWFLGRNTHGRRRGAPCGLCGRSGGRLARRHRSGHLLYPAGLDDTPPGDFDLTGGRLRPATAPSAPTFTPPEVWRQLPAALRKVGLSESEAELVLGRNMMRVAQQVWSAAP
jgi:membrane dipeptidase